MALLSPFQLGGLSLRNRAVMSPMTRLRCGGDGVPSQIVATYYGQRASAGLVIAEATWPDVLGRSASGMPGLADADQVSGWHRVTDAVHGGGGHIFAQLQHAGRAVPTSILAPGQVPLAPSPLALMESDRRGTGSRFMTPHALGLPEVETVIAGYADATRRAMDAGFDGVELHAASGGLPNQFLAANTNRRTDRYGGSAEARCRFVIDVLAAMIDVAGPGRVGVKVAPGGTHRGIRDADPEETYGVLSQMLNSLPLGYVHVQRHLSYLGELAPGFDEIALVRGRYEGALIAAGGYDASAAEKALEGGAADLIAFGRPFISNPDLVYRIAVGGDLVPPDPDTFYAGGERGYADYPPLS